VPIGRPIANTKLYILDEKQEPVGVGESGELYIGGAGLARGYVGRAEETAEKFVPNPYSAQGGERLYRTGDVAKYRWDGEIEYQGRMDQQVKLRGYRIELGEIEGALSGHERVGEVAVVIREERGEKRIVAYVAGEKTGEEERKNVTGVELKKYLRERLPEYMVPSEVVVLEEMPLTANGKIARNALPALTGSRSVLEGAYVAPQNETEQVIANLWKEVLHLDKVGRCDNFFDLGGHSLLMLELHTKLQETFKTDLALVEMFKYPTIASLAEYLGQNRKSAPDYERINKRAARQNAALSRRRRRNDWRESVNE
jgi:acyl carrier protein